MAKAVSDRVYRVAEALGRRIVADEVSPGSPLPTEPEIQSEQGVSRTVVREATKLLAAKGLVETRPRSGTKVRPHNNWSMLDPDVMRWSILEDSDGEFVKSLYEFRFVVEPHAALLAAERIDGDGRAQLGAALSGLLDQTAELDVRMASDIDFHRIILATTDNPIMQSLGDLVATSLEIAFSFSWSSPRRESALEMHREVHDAIVAGEGEDAFFAMRRLINGAQADVLDGLLRTRMAKEQKASQ